MTRQVTLCRSFNLNNLFSNWYALIIIRHQYILFMRVSQTDWWPDDFFLDCWTSWITCRTSPAWWLSHMFFPLLTWLILMFSSSAGLQAFQLPETTAVVILICGCCPGGAASNILALALKGDMNLRYKDVSTLVENSMGNVKENMQSVAACLLDVSFFFFSEITGNICFIHPHKKSSSCCCFL